MLTVSHGYLNWQKVTLILAELTDKEELAKTTWDLSMDTVISTLPSDHD